MTSGFFEPSQPRQDINDVIRVIPYTPIFKSLIEATPYVLKRIRNLPDIDEEDEDEDEDDKPWSAFGGEYDTEDAAWKVIGVSDPNNIEQVNDARLHNGLTVRQTIGGKYYIYELPSGQSETEFEQQYTDIHAALLAASENHGDILRHGTQHLFSIYHPEHLYSDQEFRDLLFIDDERAAIHAAKSGKPYELTNIQNRQRKSVGWRVDIIDLTSRRKENVRVVSRMIHTKLDPMSIPALENTPAPVDKVEAQAESLAKLAYRYGYNRNQVYNSILYDVQHEPLSTREMNDFKLKISNKLYTPHTFSAITNEDDVNAYMSSQWYHNMSPSPQSAQKSAKTRTSSGTILKTSSTSDSTPNTPIRSPIAPIQPPATTSTVTPPTTSSSSSSSSTSSAETEQRPIDEAKIIEAKIATEYETKQQQRDAVKEINEYYRRHNINKEVTTRMLPTHANRYAIDHITPVDVPGILAKTYRNMSDAESDLEILRNYTTDARTYKKYDIEEEVSGLGTYSIVPRSAKSAATEPSASAPPAAATATTTTTTTTQPPAAATATQPPTVIVTASTNKESKVGIAVKHQEEFTSKAMAEITAHAQDPRHFSRRAQQRHDALMARQQPIQQPIDVKSEIVDVEVDEPTEEEIAKLKDTDENKAANIAKQEADFKEGLQTNDLRKLVGGRLVLRVRNIYPDHIKSNTTHINKTDIKKRDTDHGPEYSVEFDLGTDYSQLKSQLQKYKIPLGKAKFSPFKNPKFKTVDNYVNTYNAITNRNLPLSVDSGYRYISDAYKRDPANVQIIVKPI